MRQSLVSQVEGEVDFRPAFFRNPLPRGLALFLGGFALLNLLGSLRVAEFDANLWWIDLRFLPRTFAQGVLLVAAVGLIGFAIRPPHAGWRRTATLACSGILALAALANALQFYWLLAHGKVTARCPIALSFFIAAALALIFLKTLRVRNSDSRNSNSVYRSCRSSLVISCQIAGVCLACAFAFPLLQMFCFGKTDYRRPADVAVVLGARVYADGRPSDALADRVRTACQLYRDGLAKHLIFSGGPGDGLVHETESMQRMAIRLGVKPEDIVLDKAGVNTQATVANSAALLTRLHASRVLVVSHFYHLPRIKLAYRRAGQEVYTVPARETYALRQLPYNMLREVPALWVYYLRPLARA